MRQSGLGFRNKYLAQKPDVFNILDFATLHSIGARGGGARAGALASRPPDRGRRWQPGLREGGTLQTRLRPPGWLNAGLRFVCFLNEKTIRLPCGGSTAGLQLRVRVVPAAVLAVLRTAEALQCVSRARVREGCSSCFSSGRSRLGMKTRGAQFY